MTDPATAAAIFKFGAKEVFKNMAFRDGKSAEELAKLKVDRLNRQIALERDATRGGSVDIPRDIEKYEPRPRVSSEPPRYTDEAKAYLAAELIRAKEHLASFRPVVAPPPVAPPPVAPPPIVTTPPVVIEPPPRVVTGEVLTASQKVAYDEALRQFRTFEGLAKYGGRGSVGGALRLGAAIWQEFGQEILIENAQKAAAAKAKAAAAEARKGPLGRRAKTAKSGKIKRPPQPPQPPQPPRPRIADAVRQAKAQTTANRVAKTAPDQREQITRQLGKGPSTRSGARNSKQAGLKQTNIGQPAPVLTRSQWLGIGSAGAAAISALLGPKVSQQLLKSAEETLATLNPKPGLQTQLQPATGSAGGGQLGTQTRTAEGNKGERCRIVCRKTGKRKKKKRSRKVCIDKGTLTKFVKSTFEGK